MVFDRKIHRKKVYDTMHNFVYDLKRMGAIFFENGGVWHKREWHKM